MMSEKIYKCDDCGSIGPSVKRFRISGWFLNIVACVFFSILWSIVVTPLIGIPLGVAMFYFFRKDHCSSCNSGNVSRYLTEEQLLAIAKNKEERLLVIAEKKEKKERDRAEIILLKKDLIDNSNESEVVKIKIIGGVGWGDFKNLDVHLKISRYVMEIYDLNGLRKVSIEHAQVRSIDIGGPGTVSAGPNIVGGGFGAEGAITGMAVATVANILLTHSSTKTIVRLLLNDAEIVFLSSELDPDSMRTLMSPVYVALNQQIDARNDSISNQLLQLKSLRETGALSDEQYQRAVDKLLL